MKRKKGLQIHKKHRVFSLLLTAVFLVMSVSMLQERYALADENDSTQKTEADAEADAEAKAEEISSKLLKDEHGRIVFWEWNKVTTKNVFDVFKRGYDTLHVGTYYPSMLVMHDSKMNPVGFISTYADRSHVFYGKDEVPWDATFSMLGDGEQTKMDAVYKTINQGGPVDVTNGFVKDNNRYILLDSDSQLLNNDKDLFSESTFFTAGTPMGVLYFAPVNAGYTSAFLGVTTWQQDFEVPYVTMQIALARGSAKGNSGDMSYNSIGKTAGVTDYYIMHPLDSADIRIVMRDRYEELLVRMHNYTAVVPGSGGSSDNSELMPKNNKASEMFNLDMDISNDIEFFGMYPFKGEKDTDKWMIMSNECWSFLGVKNGYLLNINIGYLLQNMQMSTDNLAMIKKALSATDPSVYNVFTWYIGTPHVFASIKGEGGDQTTGAGGTTKVGKGETLILKDTSYLDVDGNNAKSEGVVLPEGSKIEIEEGGVLSIEGNFINNGRVINKGGTIIIKDGGCVSPFGTTKEGTIECSAAASGQTGDIIIMPGGKLYSLIKNSKLNDTANINSTAPALSMSGGSTLINYGTFVTNLTRMEGSCKIENRKDAAAFIGYYLDDPSVLINNCKVTKNSIDHFAKFKKEDWSKTGGVRAVVATSTDSSGGKKSTESKGIVLTDSTATLNLGISKDEANKGATYKNPEY